MDKSNERPLVTFALFTFNQERFIREAVEGALRQHYSPLEIIISDDCSTDCTFDIIRDIVESYSGPHTIVLNRNSRNEGLIAHVNKLFSIARGELIVVAAGDDISRPDRTAELVMEYLIHDKPLLIHSKATLIDEHGHLSGGEAPAKRLRKNMTLIETISSPGIYLGASGAWSRELIQKFGPIDNKNTYEDLVMGFRAATENRLSYIDKPLLYYRAGIGISHTECAKLKEQINQRIAEMRRWENVTSQRINDLKRIDYKDSTIEKKLNNKMLISRISRDFYENLKFIPAHLSRNPITVARSALLEIKFWMEWFLRKMLKKFNTSSRPSPHP